MSERKDMRGQRVSQPNLLVFTGPMFGSKTTKMLSVLERALYQSKRVIAFKPKMDERYEKSMIVTHAGLKFDAHNVQTGEEILKMSEGYDVVGVDESFMIEGSASALVALFKSGKTIAVSSIQLSASGKPFEEIRDLLPWATHIEVCPAVCLITGEDAYYTVRKAKGISEIEVGGSETYEPRAWSCTPFMNDQFGES